MLEKNEPLICRWCKGDLKQQGLPSTQQILSGTVLRIVQPQEGAKGGDVSRSPGRVCHAASLCPEQALQRHCRPILSPTEDGQTQHLPRLWFGVLACF